MERKKHIAHQWLLLLFAAAVIVFFSLSVKAVSVHAASSVKQVTGVESTVKSTSSVKISWNKVSGASKYQVYQKIGKSGTWKKVKTTSSTSYTAKSLKTGKTYYYKVRAYKKTSSKTTYGKFSSSVKYTGGTPAKTTGVSLSASKDGSIKISWS